MLNIPYNNYKTQVCKYYAENQQCHFGKNCTYAHGDAELRKPYEELPPDAVPSLEMTNPSAFRLLNAQMTANQPKVTPINSQDLQMKQKIQEISSYFQDDQKDQGLKIL